MSFNLIKGNTFDMVYDKVCEILENVEPSCYWDFPFCLSTFILSTTDNPEKVFQVFDNNFICREYGGRFTLLNFRKFDVELYNDLRKHSQKKNLKFRCVGLNKEKFEGKIQVTYKDTEYMMDVSDCEKWNFFRYLENFSGKARNRRKNQYRRYSNSFITYCFDDLSDVNRFLIDWKKEASKRLFSVRISHHRKYVNEFFRDRKNSSFLFFLRNSFLVGLIGYEVYQNNVAIAVAKFRDLGDFSKFGWWKWLETLDLSNIRKIYVGSSADKFKKYVGYQPYSVVKFKE